MVNVDLSFFLLQDVQSRMFIRIRVGTSLIMVIGQVGRANPRHRLYQGMLIHVAPIVQSLAPCVQRIRAGTPRYLNVARRRVFFRVAKGVNEGDVTHVTFIVLIHPRVQASMARNCHR